MRRCIWACDQVRCSIDRSAASADRTYAQCSRSATGSSSISPRWSASRVGALGVDASDDDGHKVEVAEGWLVGACGCRSTQVETQGAKALQGARELVENTLDVWGQDHVISKPER